MGVNSRWRRVVALTRATVHLRMRGVKGGWKAVYGGARPHIVNLGEIRLGERVTIGGPLFASELHVRENGALIIGDNVLISAGVSIHCRESIHIGDNARLAPLVAVIDTDAHELVPGSGVRSAPVFIGADVWVARGAQVLAGVSIGDGAVVGAGAVVTRDVPPHTLVVGVPARVIRQLSYVPGVQRQ